MNADDADNRLQRLRKIAGLILLGIAVGLGISQVLALLKHEVTIEIILSDELLRDLTELDLRVSEAGSDAPAVSVTRFFFDENHRPSKSLLHTITITNGRYDLHFTIRKNTEQAAITEERLLDVSGAMQMSYHLPL